MLSYGGAAGVRRLLEETVEPLLGCAATPPLGLGGKVAEVAAAGESVSAGGGGASSGGDGGQQGFAGGDGPEAEAPSRGSVQNVDLGVDLGVGQGVGHGVGKEEEMGAVEVEVLVGFEDPGQAGLWAQAAAESGGRVVPLLRPGGRGELRRGGGVDKGGHGPGAVGGSPAAASGVRGEQRAGQQEQGRPGQGQGQGEAVRRQGPAGSPVRALNRLVGMARGEVVLLLQVGTGWEGGWGGVGGGEAGATDRAHDACGTQRCKLCRIAG